MVSCRDGKNKAVIAMWWAFTSALHWSEEQKRAVRPFALFMFLIFSGFICRARGSRICWVSKAAPVQLGFSYSPFRPRYLARTPFACAFGRS